VAGAGVVVSVAESSEVSLRSGNSYVAYLPFDAHPSARSLITQQLAAWLRSKELEPSLTESGLYQSKDRELAVLTRDPDQGGDLSASLVEQSTMGVWRTEITLNTPTRGPGWVVIDVANDDDHFVKVPRLARYVTDVVETHDGEGSLSSKPLIVGISRVEEVIDIVCDPDRRGLAFVAGTNRDNDVDSFVRKVDIWTRQVQGLAQVIVLDPQATGEFARKVGPSHAAPAWLLRTYLPEADPASSVDARRHKILGARRLQERSENDIQIMLGRISRAHAGSVPLPVAVTHVRRSFTRQRDSVVVDEISRQSTETTISPVIDTKARATPKPRAAPRFSPRPTEILFEDEDSPTAETSAELELVKSQLGLESITEQTLEPFVTAREDARALPQVLERVTQQLSERQGKLEAIQDGVALLREQYEDELIEHAVADEERSNLADENRWLRNRLKKLEDFATAYQSMPDESRTIYPESFESLIGRLDELEADGVIFTGTAAHALDLDDVDSLRKLVRAAWESLLVLADYVRARRAGVCDKGVEGYLKATPEGFRQMPLGKHAANETRRTMDAWGGERRFPVPTDVGQDGSAVMEAHFKLGRVGMVSPRLYYLDRWIQNQHVYVGYIGAHLTNTKSN
jgi:hypothetical protein